MRVFTTSRGNVTSHPATPAVPPARSNVGHDKVDISVSTSERIEEWSEVDCAWGEEGGVGVKYLHVASYLRHVGYSSGFLLFSFLEGRVRRKGSPLRNKHH